MSLPDDILREIIIRLPPTDYMRISAVSRAFRRILSDERFVRQWVREGPPAAWKKPILIALMIRMCEDFPTITTLARVAKDLPTAPYSYLAGIVLGENRSNPCHYHDFCIRYNAQCITVVRSDKIEVCPKLWLQTTGYRVNANNRKDDVRFRLLCDVVNTRLACERGIIMDDAHSPEHVLRLCTFITKLTSTRHPYV